MLDDPSSPSVEIPGAPTEAYQGDKPSVFVSYSNQDREAVFAEIRWLVAQGYRVWYDEGINPGTELPARIQHALERCAFFLVFLSPRAVESKNVRNEINYALNHHKPFLAVHLEQTALSHGLALRIGDIQALYRYTLSPDLYRRRLQRALPAAIQGPMPSAAEGLDFPDDSFSSRESITLPGNTATPLDPAKSYLLELQPDGQFRPWELRKAFYTVGRLDVLITLTDRRVSRRHLVVARLGSDWYVLNVSPTKKMWVGGWELRQKKLRDGDVIRIGTTWLVFVAARTRNERRYLRRFEIGGRLKDLFERRSMDSDEDFPLSMDSGSQSLEQPQGGSCRVEFGKESFSSDSVDRPILIGNHAGCSVRVAGTGVAPFHAFLTWMPEGLCLFDLDSGSGTMLDGVPARCSLVRDRQTITLGDRAVKVQVSGDATAPARKRKLRTPVRLGLTSVNGSHKNETTLLEVNGTALLGRSDPADLLLPREVFLSPQHLQLRTTGEEGDGGRLLMRICPRGDTCRTWINTERVKEFGDARPGDVIHFSPTRKVAGTALLVHYDPNEHAW